MSSRTVPVIVNQNLRKLEIALYIFRKTWNIKFHENPSNAADLFREDGHTYMTQVAVAFRNFELAGPRWHSG
jgi:hypothetical protein